MPGISNQAQEASQYLRGLSDQLKDLDEVQFREINVEIAVMAGTLVSAFLAFTFVLFRLIPS